MTTIARTMLLSSILSFSPHRDLLNHTDAYSMLTQALGDDAAAIAYVTALQAAGVDGSILLDVMDRAFAQAALRTMIEVDDGHDYHQDLMEMWRMYVPSEDLNDDERASLYEDVATVLASS